MGFKWKWHDIYGFMVLFLAVIFCFIYAATAMAEKQPRALVISLIGVFFGAAVIVTYWRLKLRGHLDTRRTQKTIQTFLVGMTLFALFCLLPTQGTVAPVLTDCGTTKIVGAQTQLDARQQPGSDLYLAMSEKFGGTDELTLSIYDICVGKISYKVHRDDPVNPRVVEITNSEVLTQKIKVDAKVLGAEVVGICKLDPAYVFTHDQAGRPINLHHKYAIVLGREIDYWLAGPSAPLPWEAYYSSLPEELAAALSNKTVKTAQKVPEEVVQEVKETLQFFSEGGKTAVELAKRIRELGYPARAHYQRWSEVQIIPLAISAGLGELSRNGMLISRHLGPRGSFAVVTTDLPLKTDKPLDEGIEAFCRICKKCAESCPVQAVPYGGHQMVRGALKWTVDGEKCAPYIVANPKCMACIYACPYNKPDYWVHRVGSFLAGRKNAVTNYLLVKLDNLLGYGVVRPNMTPPEKVKTLLDTEFPDGIR